MCNQKFNSFGKQYGAAILLQLFCCMAPAAAQNAPAIDSTEQKAASAPAELNELLARYPAGSIRTAEDANHAGDNVHKMHALIDAQFAEDQRNCYPKFFTTSCLNDAKERHRTELAKVRVIEIEVNKFKRKENIEARNKALAARQEKAIAEESSHQTGARSATQGDANNASQSVSTPPVAPADAKGNSRIEKHQREVRKRQAEESQNEQRRARNIAAYEKKVQEAQARQREIAAKKLKKAQSRKSASEAK
jgi:hypothetical protein